jgi:hypothetical protein
MLEKPVELVRRKPEHAAQGIVGEIAALVFVQSESMKPPNQTDPIRARPVLVSRIKGMPTFSFACWTKS